MSFCKKCGKAFMKRAGNQIYCSDCSFWKTYEGGKVMKMLFRSEPALKAAADASGNPRIWTAEEYTQDELRRLIPAR